MNEDLTRWLEGCADAGMRSVCDLGCGDVEWVARVQAIREGEMAYHGIDVKAPLIAHHRRVFPWFRGEAVDAECAIDERKPGREAEVVVVNGLLECLCRGAAGQVLMNVSRWTTWRRLLVSSHPGAKNGMRRGVRNGKPQPYDVEAGLQQEKIEMGVPAVRIPQPDGGEWLVWLREPLG